MRIIDSTDDIWELHGAIRVSIRYHDRRCRFFEMAHRATAGTGAIFGIIAMAALLGLLNQSLGVAATALVTSMSVIDLVAGFTESAELHRQLRRRFVELEQEVITDSNGARLGELLRCQLVIERDEPPVRRALLTLVQNEQILSGYLRQDDSLHFVPVSLWRRLTAHVFAHAKHA